MIFPKVISTQLLKLKIKESSFISICYLSSNVSTNILILYKNISQVCLSYHHTCANTLKAVTFSERDRIYQYVIYLLFSFNFSFDGNYVGKSLPVFVLISAYLGSYRFSNAQNQLYVYTHQTAISMFTITSHVCNYTM